MSNWPSQVHQGLARKDGLTPADFDYAKWPVSNVRLEQPTYNETQHGLMVRYRCDISPDTPHANQYDADGTPIPDPVGICLSRVRFTLVDAGNYDILDTDLSDHHDGAVIGALSLGSQIWHRFKPGEHTSLDVRLQAVPLFMYLDAQGSVHAEYALQNQGYFGGVMVESDMRTLTMTEDGTLLLDGAPPPPEPITAQTIYTPAEAELQAEMAREHEEVERAHREEAARMAKQQAELDAAEAIIYGRRDKYKTDEDWLFGVLADKTLDFGTVRKYVYTVAHKVGFEMEQARKRRQEKRDAEAAQRRKEYEAEQDKQAQADAVEMVESMFDTYGADTDTAKAELLRKVINEPRMAKYHDAAKAVAASLGITL